MPAGWKGAPKLEAVFDFSTKGIMDSFQSSLQRLRLKSVDILLIHDCDDDIPQALRESQPAIAKLKEAGATKAIGAGLNSYETALKLAKKADFDCFLIAGRYTLLEQGALEEFLPYCDDHQIGVIIGAPFNSGILASDLSANSKYNYEDAPPELLKKARKIKEACDVHSTPLRAAALQFILANPVVTSTIPGCRSPREVEDNAERARVQDTQRICGTTSSRKISSEKTRRSRGRPTCRVISSLRRGISALPSCRRRDIRSSRRTRSRRCSIRR